MIVETKFTYYSHYVYIPDGYICDINKVHLLFFDWIENQPDCITISPGGRGALTFDADVFLRYLNTEVLKDTNEKAYFVEKISGKSEINATLYF